MRSHDDTPRRRSGVPLRRDRHGTGRHRRGRHHRRVERGRPAPARPCPGGGRGPARRGSAGPGRRAVAAPAGDEPSLERTRSRCAIRTAASGATYGCSRTGGSPSAATAATGSLVTPLDDTDPLPDGRSPDGRAPGAVPVRHGDLRRAAAAARDQRRDGRRDRAARENASAGCGSPRSAAGRRARSWSGTCSRCSWAGQPQGRADLPAGRRREAEPHAWLARHRAAHRRRGRGCAASV